MTSIKEKKDDVVGDKILKQINIIFEGIEVCARKM